MNTYLEFYDRVLKDENVTFGEFSSNATRTILSKNLNLSSGLALLERKLPRITEEELELDYSANHGISGSESVIYFKSMDDKYIYKLNDPELKLEKSSKFNDYIFNFLLTDYVCPPCRYDHLKYMSVDKRPLIFMRQRSILGQVPPFSKIKFMLKENRWTFLQDSGSFVANLSGFDILMEDANEKNCLIKNNQLYIFDARFKLL